MPRAAVMVENDAPIEVWPVEVAPPRAGEVRVQVVAAGVCHSDLHVWHRGPVTPIVLGHEAAGVVLEVGAGVTEVAAGDHVVFMPFPQCRRCRWCRAGQPTLCVLREGAFSGRQADGTTRVTHAGAPVYQLSGLGAFAEVLVTTADGVVPVDRDVDLSLAALVGCGVTTGFGAVARVGRVRPGESVAVIGCGGVGLNAVQAARIGGAERIVAVDQVPAKLDLARRLGATDTVQAGDGIDVVGLGRELTAGIGVDVACDMIGTPPTMRQALDLTRAGGRCVLTGLAGGELGLSAAAVVGGGKAILGNYLGMCDFRVEFPRLIGLYRNGQLDLEALVSQRLGLDSVNDALAALATGAVARTVLSLA